MLGGMAKLTVKLVRTSLRSDICDYVCDVCGYVCGDSYGDACGDICGDACGDAFGEVYSKNYKKWAKYRTLRNAIWFNPTCLLPRRALLPHRYLGFRGYHVSGDNILVPPIALGCVCGICVCSDNHYVPLRALSDSRLGRQFLHARHHHRTCYCKVFEYYSPVGGSSLAFYCIEDSEQRGEIWTKRRTIPAPSMGKAVEALALYALFIFNREKARVRIAPELYGPLLRRKRKHNVFVIVLHEG